MPTSRKVASGKGAWLLLFVLLHVILANSSLVLAFDEQHQEQQQDQQQQLQAQQQQQQQQQQASTSTCFFTQSEPLQVADVNLIGLTSIPTRDYILSLDIYPTSAVFARDSNIIQLQSTSKAQYDQGFFIHA